MLKLLIVEDNFTNLYMLEQTIKNLNLEIKIITQKDGEDQYQKFLEHRPNLIFMDIGLPKIDGFEVIRKIREIDNECNIHIISQFQSVDDFELGKQVGQNDYLVKPHSLKDIRNIIYKFMENDSV